MTRRQGRSKEDSAGSETATKKIRRSRGASAGASAGTSRSRSATQPTGSNAIIAQPARDNTAPNPRIAVENEGEEFNLDVSGSDSSANDVGQPTDNSQPAPPRLASGTTLNEPEMPHHATDPIHRCTGKSATSNTEDVRYFFSREKGQRQYCEKCR